MTMPDPDRRQGDRRQMMTQIRPVRGWLGEDVRVTRGWLLLCITVGFTFTGLSFSGAVAVVNGLRRDDCESANVRRSEALDVALADVEGDRAIWNSFDNLIPKGIPEPTRAIVFASLDAREAKAEDVYAAQPCP